MKLKPSVTKKRVEEIERLQEAIKTVCEEFKDDFANDPPPLSPAVEADCKKAIAGLELLAGIYRSRTEKG